jgi:glycosyltransferase involved in cell wall biosynthesis
MEAERAPTVSVVVPTLDRPEMVRESVAALFAGDGPLEVLVVDQSAGDATRRAVEDVGDERVRYVSHSPPSTSAARNRGAEEAAGVYVGFLDDDMEVPASWVASVRAELERLDFPDALFGELRAPDGFSDRQTLPVSLFTVGAARLWERPVHPNRLGYAANFVVRRSVFLELGGFDTRLGPGSRFYGAEDMDLNYRLLKGGFRVASTPAVWTIHEQWRPAEALPRLFFGYNVGGAAFCAKHLRAGDARAAGFLLEQIADDGRMFASAVRQRSALRARVAAGRTAGTWWGVAAGLTTLGGSRRDRGIFRRGRRRGGS